jgi:hypothetical protein
MRKGMPTRYRMRKGKKNVSFQHIYLLFHCRVDCKFARNKKKLDRFPTGQSAGSEIMVVEFLRNEQTVVKMDKETRYIKRKTGEIG